MQFQSRGMRGWCCARPHLDPAWQMEGARLVEQCQVKMSLAASASADRALTVAAGQQRVGVSSNGGQWRAPAACRRCLNYPCGGMLGWADLHHTRVLNLTAQQMAVVLCCASSVPLGEAHLGAIRRSVRRRESKPQWPLP
jgi:hypothetical protein